MYTSYFARNGNNPNAVAICAKVPDFFVGRHYKLLAPSWSIFKEYKETLDSKRYTERFLAEILAPLDPLQVYEDLGDNAILLCYESPGKFCHRHLVSNWFFNNLNIKVCEI